MDESTEVVLATRPDGIVNPATGQVVGPDASDDDLAALLAFLRDVDTRVRNLRRIAGGWMLERMDRDAKWTRRAGGRVLKGTSPSAAGDYDADMLDSALLRLLADDEITQRAYDACWRREVSKAGVNAVLAALSPERQSEVRAAMKPTVRGRTVSVD